MILDKLFSLMAEKQASDIFITAGAPIHIKIQGNTVPVNQQVMLPDMIEKIAYELMSPDQIKTFESTMEMNLSFGIPQVGNFRVNIFRQRGSIGMVVRFIMGNIPGLDTLGLPEVLGELIMEKRGLVNRRRNTADARTVLVKLTPKGRKLTKELIPLGLRNERFALQGFSSAEVDQLLSLLSRIYENAEGLLP